MPRRICFDPYANVLPLTTDGKELAQMAAEAIVFQARNPPLPLSKPKGFIVYPWKGQKAKMKAASACGITDQYWKVERGRQIVTGKDVIILFQSINHI